MNFTKSSSIKASKTEEKKLEPVFYHPVKVWVLVINKLFVAVVVVDDVDVDKMTRLRLLLI